MQITKLDEEFPWTVVPRTSGVHLTDIISDILLTLNLAKEYDSNSDPRLQYEKGYLWEVVLSRAFAEKVAHQIGEIELDGILCTPDGISWDDKGSVVVEENKCTARSSKRSPDENIAWMMQGKGYCKVTGATSCIFRIFHHTEIMWNPSGCYAPWKLEFSQTEIDENWFAIVNHAKMRGWLS